jgi:EpsI family protein
VPGIFSRVSLRREASGTAMNLVAIGGLLSLVTVLNWSTVAALIVRWTDSVDTTYSHGYLVVVVFIWLLWRARAELQPALATTRSMGAATALVLVVGIFWLIAFHAGIQLIQMLMLPLLMWLAMVAAFGRTVGGKTLFACAYLYFSIPIWTAVNSAAQWSTVYAVRFALRLVGVPAYFSGNTVQIPEGVFEIADGCSGLHFLIVALSVGALLGELRRDSGAVRIQLLVLSVAFAAVTNWVRVFSVVLAGHLTDMQHYLVRVDHKYFGWVLFAIALPGFFAIAKRLGVEVSGGASAPQAALQADAVVRRREWPMLVRMLPVTLALAAPHVWGSMIAGQEFLAHAVALPAAGGSWKEAAISQSSWSPRFDNADGKILREYTRASDTVVVYRAWYVQQRQGRELGAYDNSIAGDRRAVPGAPVSAAGKMYNSVTTSDSEGHRMLIWYGFGIGDAWFTRPMFAQLRYSLESITRLRSPISSVVAFAMICASDCIGERATLEDFLEQVPGVKP